MKNKKAQALNNLQALIAPLIGVAVVLVVGFLIMAEVKTQASTIENDGGTGYAVNATRDVQLALDDIPGWLPIIIVAIIGAILLGLVQFFRT